MSGRVCEISEETRPATGSKPASAAFARSRNCAAATRRKWPCCAKPTSTCWEVERRGSVRESTGSRYRQVQVMDGYKRQTKAA